MKVWEFPEKRIRIVLKEPGPPSETTEMPPEALRILRSNQPGTYIVSRLPDSVTHEPYEGSIYGEKDMFVDPSFFHKKKDPDDPFKKYDPDADHLQPPGGSSGNYFI